MKHIPNPSPNSARPFEENDVSRTRTGLLTAILFSVATLEAGCIPQSTSHPKQTECADFQLEVDQFWSSGIRAEILNHSGKVEIEHRKAIVNKMDQTSEDWVRLRQSACMDHARGLISQNEYKARTVCFDKWLQQQRSLVAAIRGGGNLNEAENSLNSVINNVEQCK